MATTITEVEPRLEAAQGPGSEAYSKEPVRKSTWTFMFYLAGDNNLDDDMIWTLKEVYRVGVPDGFSVTAQFDSSSRRGVRIYRPRKPLDVDGVFSVLHDREDGEEDSGDPNVLVDFVLESVRRAPADHYMLILSGHGSGVIGDFLTDEDTERRRSLQPGSLTIPDLTRVFDRLRRELGPDSKTVIDVLGMDSCLMSMAEVCAEVKGQVGLIVGSEGFEPNAGWPYYRLLEGLASADLEPEALAKRLVRRYTTYYSDFVDAGLSVDLAVCDVREAAFTPFEQAVAEFVKEYLQEIQKKDFEWLDSAIVLAHWRAQSYKGEFYTDVYDFFDQLRAECERLKTIAGVSSNRFDAIMRKAEAVMEAVSGGGNVKSPVVVLSDLAGPELQHSHGLSVYFPWSLRTYEDSYLATAFAKRTGWHAFLQRHLAGTQRLPREFERANPAAAGAGPAPRGTDGEVILAFDDVFDADGNPRPAPADGVAGRMGNLVPSSRNSAPSTRNSAPSTRNSAPSTRNSAPSTRNSAPSTRNSAPSTRNSAPSTRFAQDVQVLLHELPSRMKNQATQFVPVIRVDGDAAARIEGLRPGDGSKGLQALQQALIARK